MVRTTVDRYLNAVDNAVPGLVTGLYVTGSAVLDDFHPGISDLDVVVVTDGRPSDADLAWLERVHTAMARAGGPALDGPYVTWAQLAGDPAAADLAGHVHDGRFHRSTRPGWDPVTWHILAHAGAAVRGPSVVDLALWTDGEALLRYSRRNLDTYWVPWLSRSRKLLSRHGVASLVDWGPSWGVLGIARVHRTLATGEIISKSAAAEHARETFGEQWLRIIDECLRIHGGAAGRSRYRNPFERRRDALNFVELVIDSARRLNGG